MAFTANQVLRGTFGKCWLDGERMSNVKSFEAKVSAEYEDVKVNGDLVTHKRYIGCSISGTMTLYKTDSTIAGKVAAAFTEGVMPSMTVVCANTDPQSSGKERVALYEVQFDELTLGKFENGSLTEEEVPFTCGGFEYLDMI